MTRKSRRSNADECFMDMEITRSNAEESPAIESLPQTLNIAIDVSVDKPNDNWNTIRLTTKSGNLSPVPFQFTGSSIKLEADIESITGFELNVSESESVVNLNQITIESSTKRLLFPLNSTTLQPN